MYQTSFYMHVDNYVKLSAAAKQTGISRHKLIIQLMYRYAKEHKKMQVEKGTVQYQKMDNKNKWQVFRVVLSEKDYELFTDMRKVMKKSVSYLVALAIKKYLDTLVGKILNNVFNYTRLKYRSGGKKGGDIKIWVLLWKIEEKPQALIT